MATAPWTMVWFYNSSTGSVISEPALGDTIQSHLPGWHGPFGTKQEALDYFTSHSSANPSWKAPTGLAGALTNEGGDAAAAATSGIGGTLGALLGNSASSPLLRIVEILLGIALVAVGVAKLTGAVPAATKIARAVS
jgi:hypothetical protein